MNEKIVQKIIQIVGKENILQMPEDCYPYAFDLCKTNNADIPDLVVMPENAHQIAKILKIANEEKIPVVPRGSATNQVGACITRQGSIVISFAKMNKILEINPKNLVAKVQPGVVIGQLNKKLEEYGLFFAPDPSSLDVSTIGGAIAQSASGPHHIKYGGTKEHILDLQVASADGQLFNTGANVKKNVAGYDLTHLMIGSEGTLGVVCEATLKLLPTPEKSCLILAFFEDLESSAKAVTNLISSKLRPSAIDLLDKYSIQVIENFSKLNVFEQTEACLIIEIDGTEKEIEEQSKNILKVLKTSNAKNTKWADTQEDIEEIWFARRQGFSALARLNVDVLAEDIVVPVDRLADMIKKIQEIAHKYSILIATFGHAGDGNLHPHFSVDLRDNSQKLKFKQAEKDMMEYVLSLGGSITGEHGIGFSKKPYLQDMTGAVAIYYMKKIKEIFDPNNILNPEKIL